MEPIRINKFFTEYGILSRRQCDDAILAGRIQVNGKIAVPGIKVTDEDEILLDGKNIKREKPKKIVFALNKPVGVVSTTRKFKNEENVIDLIGYPEKLYPVGRLDKDSEGLIFLTNDGALAKEITDAAGKHEKEYEVTVDRVIKDEFLKKMEHGVYLSDLMKTTKACKIRKTGEKKFRIVLTQGLNRQIRRMCETLHYEVKTLKRVRIQNVLLSDLKPGEYREIRGTELKELKGEMNPGKKKIKAI